MIALTKGYLCPSQPFNGKVHSVFRRAINITTDLTSEPWVSLLGQALPATPTAFQCDFGAHGDLTALVKAGDVVFMRGGVIRLPAAALVVNTSAAKDWPQTEPIMLLNQALIQRNFGLAEAGLSQHCVAPQQQRIRSAHEYIQHLGLTTPMCLASAPEWLTNNIGYGKGLTPSGDDFLLGVLAVLSSVYEIYPKAADIFQRIALQVQQQLGKTTDISAHYLSLALSRHFSQPVQWLVYYLLTTQDESTIAIAMAKNLSIGASSGADTIAGILYCITQLLLS